MEKIDITKPCVVQTPQGFSVSYKNHFLYSKYSPSKTILNSIEQLTILPGTIILCFSPVLEYGFNELKAKLPENCLLVFCEADKELFKFESNYTFTNEKMNLLDSVLNLNPDELSDLPLILYSLNNSGKYKRVIRLDFSAGTQFHKSFYDELYSTCVNSIMTFWKNRITLTKFGRQYSKNLFCNLSILTKTCPITSFFNSVTKPIIVFGAGQSLDLFFEHSNDFSPSKYFILCADTALQPLLDRNIKPDGVFIEEAQSVISKAFIGVPDNIHIFAGLSSLPQIALQRSSQNISFFTTEYTKAFFLDSLQKQNFLPPLNPPYGSVGLTTVHYALKFRKDDTIPVFVVGLDFSYTAGITHAKNTLAHVTRLFSTNRLHSIQNYGASFNSSTTKFLDKNNNTFYTTPTLQTYAELFNNIFPGTKNLFDSGECGIPLTIERKIPKFSDTTMDTSMSVTCDSTMSDTCNLSKHNNSNTTQKKTTFSPEQKQQINEYLRAEKQELLLLKDLLTGKTKLKNDELESKIKKIATHKEYLFLHFADGYCFNYTQSFLNRIRTEIDYFLKVF